MGKVPGRETKSGRAQEEGEGEEREASHDVFCRSWEDYNTDQTPCRYDLHCLMARQCSGRCGKEAQCA